MSLIAAWFRRPHPKLSALAGYMLLWIAVGNAFGWIAHWIAVYFFDMPENSLTLEAMPYAEYGSTYPFSNKDPIHYYCYPQPSMDGFHFSCKYYIYAVFWQLVVGFPSFFWFIITISIGFFRAGIWYANINWFFEGLLWLLYGIPILLIIYTGIKYWKKKNYLLFKSIIIYVISVMVWESIKLSLS